MQCQWGGKQKKPNTAPSPWDFVTLVDDRATAIGKDRVYGSGDILADRQTDRQTRTDVLITILLHRSRGRGRNQLPIALCVAVFVGRPPRASLRGHGGECNVCYSTRDGCLYDWTTQWREAPARRWSVRRRLVRTVAVLFASVIFCRISHRSETENTENVL